MTVVILGRHQDGYEERIRNILRLLFLCGWEKSSKRVKDGVGLNRKREKGAHKSNYSQSHNIWERVENN